MVALAGVAVVQLAVVGVAVNHFQTAKGVPQFQRRRHHHAAEIRLGRQPVQLVHVTQSGQQRVQLEGELVLGQSQFLCDVDCLDAGHVEKLRILRRQVFHAGNEAVYEQSHGRSPSP